MENTSVSVIIPCFCCASTVERAVLSVAQQTMKPDELILVDDCSEDDTLTVLHYLQKKYGANWIQVIALSRNSGASFARNCGWEKSSGDYVAFLDSDDAWHSKKIQIQFTWMQAHKEVALSGHGCVMLNPGKDIPVISTDSNCAHYVTRRKLLISNPFVTPSFMLRRDLHYRFNPALRYAEDHYFLLQLGLDNNIIAFLDIELAYIFKEFCVSGISRNKFKMRCGSIKNYVMLRRNGKISFLTMSVLIVYSIFKHLLFLLIGPRLHEKLNIVINRSVRRI